MIITKARTAIIVVAAAMSLAALAGPAMTANHTHGTVNAYNWDIPAGTASPSA